LSCCCLASSRGGGIISYQVNALRLLRQGIGSHLRAPPPKLHHDPPFPTTSYLPTAPHIALLSRTHSNARHSPVVLHFTATCLIARPTHQLPSHSYFLLLSCIPASLRSFCNSCHSRCHRSSVVSQPSQTPPCPTPSPPERRETRRPSAARPLFAFRSTTPHEGWEQALLDLPEGEGAPGFTLNSKSLNVSAALRLAPPALPPTTATRCCCSPLCR
jgi:hypothetical protein